MRTAAVLVYTVEKNAERKYLYTHTNIPLVCVPGTHCINCIKLVLYLQIEWLLLLLFLIKTPSNKTHLFSLFVLWFSLFKWTNKLWRGFNIIHIINWMAALVDLPPIYAHYYNRGDTARAFYDTLVIRIRIHLHKILFVWYIMLVGYHTHTHMIHKLRMLIAMLHTHDSVCVLMVHTHLDMFDKQ